MDTLIVKKNRCEYLDIARGMAIILVVLGHSIQSNIMDMDSSLVFRIIYSFHMPLFMFISGAVTAFIKKDSINLSWLVKRFFTLIIPFVAWIFVPYIFVSHTFSVKEIAQKIIRIIKSPDWGLWFLYVLFIQDCLLVILFCLEKLIKLNFAFFVIPLYYVLKLIPRLGFHYLGMSLIIGHYKFFMGGGINV